MRKTIMALILVLPMCFVLIIYSSVNIVSLSVNVSVNGIRIVDDSEDNSIHIDLAEDTEHIVTAQVQPNNATEKGYTLSSDNEDIVSVSSSGKLNAKREGTAKITATSKDKGFTDTISVVVTSSKAYDFTFSMTDLNGDNVLKDTRTGYSSTVETGLYNFDMAIAPFEFREYTLTAQDGTVAKIEKGARTILLPFSGESNFTITVPDGIKGDIVKELNLTVEKPKNGDLLINGVADGNIIMLARGVKTTELYIESDVEPSLECEYATCTVSSLGNNRYLLKVTINEDYDGEKFDAKIKAGNKESSLELSFSDFDFRVTSDMNISVEDGISKTTILANSPATFYAVPVVHAEGVTYDWTVEGADSSILKLSEDDDSVCTVRATKDGEFTLKVTPMRDGKALTDSKSILIRAVSKISAVRIANNLNVDLADDYTIPGKVMSGDSFDEYRYRLRVYKYNGANIQENSSDFDFNVSDPTLAKVVLSDNNAYLVALGAGKITLTITWKWNASFKTDIKIETDFNMVGDAVAVSTAPQLVKAEKAGIKVVLLNDIMLGTDDSGNVLSKDDRQKLLGKAKSTYNIEWYKHASESNADDTNNPVSESNAYISYAMELKNDVYGNGFCLNAEYLAHAIDGTGNPLLNEYKGPLYFVKYKEMASVAGQDNCAFLIRTKGIKLYGVTLRGCSDDSLYNNEGKYELNNLNLVGTTLDINADCDIVNCRILNGRNVVRIYGGNSDGKNYAVSVLDKSKTCNDERIHVNISGCVITQGREFLVKIGANKALMASNTNGAEPKFTDANNKSYVPVGGNNSNNYQNLLNDNYFYEHYVLTDVTIRDSVLETSGLFTVGVESNFAGKYLYEGAGKDNPNDVYIQPTKSWQHSGGTSFASVLRLKGDVRLYDWKDIDLVDSSTLIESPSGILSDWLKLDIKKLLDFVNQKYPDQYGDLIQKIDGKQYVHGGIAYYGGGINYSQLDISELKEELKDLTHYNVNISMLSKSDDANIKREGDLLPSAAGTNDFNFYMYDAKSANNYYAQQQSDQAKYGGVTSFSPFEQL